MRGKRRHDDLCSVIYKMQDDGNSARSIARLTGTPRRTVDGILGRRIVNSRNQRKLPLGQPKKTTLLQDLRAVNAFTRHRFDSMRSFVLERNIGICYSSFRNRCRQRKIRKFTAVQDVLSRHQKLVRMQWCELHLADNFDRYIFSDEMLVMLKRGSNPAKLSVYRRRGERFRVTCIFEVPYVEVPGYVLL
jgi:hypothetical protein